MASATSTPAASSGRRGASSPGPGRLFRLQEKEELRQLNDRLAIYIQRSQELERERCCMQSRMGDEEEAHSREMGTLRRLYEEELADVRSSLDGLAGDRARLQLDYGNLSEEFQKLHQRNQKKEGDLAHALSQWRKVEAALGSKNGEFIKLQSEHLRLGEDFTELQCHMENVETVLADAKTQLTSETLRRIDLENQTQTLREQLDLHKNISQQEILEIRSRYESRLVEVDSGQRQEFKSKLAESMKELRQDHKSQLQQYKTEMERTFSSKLQNAQLAAIERDDVVTSNRDELESTKLRVENLSTQLQQYQKDKLVLESSLQNLERTVDEERQAWQLKLNQKEHELLSMRNQMYSQLEDYENLLDVKLALDMEINAYRKMLEVEEHRLQLSPSPSQQAAVSRTHQHSGQQLRKGRGRKRKHEGASGSSPPSKMSMSIQQGGVSVDQIDPDGRFVRLKNNLDKEQPLGGWTLRWMFPDSKDLSFHIPSSCSLAAGKTLTICAAGAEAEADSGNLVLEAHRNWGSVTDARVILLNSEHEEVAECQAYLQAAEYDDTQLDFNQEFEAGEDIQHFHRPDLSSKEASCAIM